MLFEVTEIPESPMRFFTPDLFLRVNSTNDDVADAAQGEWELAAQAYQYHLKKVLRSAPRNVAELASACYHDAVLSGVTYDPFGRELLPHGAGGRIPPLVPRPSPTTLKLTLPDRAVALVYLAWDSVRTFAPSPGWSEHQGPVLWLYDELDEVWSRFGMFIHRVLLSNGEVWEIPFYDVVRIEVTTSEVQRLSVSR